ncbi:hypothetical protein QBC34DRAFT_443386 [Podospora aff. communis PSN243]|uniref:IBR domain-containing protein n=1 Tax=Podospora aff. communis PSN243 TaxID=3040156 RepID=A0AAV9G885_9PEZI|nr:hypothetical protein QBC34DRAFT_443386 [Podospora aff. communis PSN243]
MARVIETARKRRHLTSPSRPRQQPPLSVRPILIHGLTNKPPTPTTPTTNTTIFTIPDPSDTPFPHLQGIHHIPLNPTRHNNKKITSPLSTTPFAWTCCACATTNRLPNPNTFPLPPLNGSTFPYPPALSQTCAHCAEQICYHCPLMSVYGNDICTLGGKNLLEDRLAPAGWKCCLCEEGHYAVKRYRGGYHVLMPWREVEGIVGISGVCRHGGWKRERERLDEQGEEDVDGDGDGDDMEDHIVCADCDVVNAYGEVLGIMHEERFLEEGLVEASPLRENRAWCEAWYEWVKRETEEEMAMGELEEVGRAHHDLDLARDTVEEAVAWVGELKGEVEELKKRARKRKEGKMR